MTEQRSTTPEQNRTQETIVHRESKRDLKGPAAILSAGLLGAAFIFSGGGNEPRPANADSSSTSTPSGELATPRTSEAPGSAEPSNSSEVEIQNFTVEKLGTFEVLPGDIIAGDVAMSDTKDSAIFPLYDQDTHKAADVTDNTKTALYVDVQTPGVVHAEWGATVTRGLSAEKKAEMLKIQAISKDRAGFDKVDVVLWTGYDTTVDEAGYTVTGEQNSSVNPTPSGSPETGINNLDGLDNQSKMKVILNLFAEGTIDPNSEEGKVLMDILVNCLCGCDTKTETPTPTPSKSPEVCIPAMNDHVMKPGETYKVPTGVDFIAQGDVTIDGKRTYDNSEKTGAISVVLDEKANTIFAKYGADIQLFDCPTDALITDTYNHDVEQLKATNRSVDKNSINQLK